MENVIEDEKVLVARLEDGEFFWREDQKLKIEDLVAKLASNVTFMKKKLVLFPEHMARAGVIAASLAEQAGLTAEETAAVARAAEIYRIDLLTGIVGEFDGTESWVAPSSLVKMLRLRQLSVTLPS